MKLTEKFLKEKNACFSGVEWFKNQEETDTIKIIRTLLADNKFNWSNWLIVRVMNRKQYLSYAIFAAEQVIDIYEKRFPKNDKPRKAIEAAKKVLKSDTKENRAAADAAAAYAAADAYAAQKNMQIKIIEYGISLLGEK